MNGNEFMEISRNQAEHGLDTDPNCQNIPAIYEESEADCLRAEMGDHAFNLMCEEAEEANLKHISARDFFRGVPGRGVDY